MRPPTWRLLVTAVGADLGQALVKALRLAPEPMEIYGCDVEEAGIGEAFVDSYQVVPWARDRERYLEKLTGICRSLDIQAVLPGCEPEIEALSALGAPGLIGRAVVVCQPSLWMQTYGDKLRCMRALEGRVPMVPYADGADLAAVEQLLGKAGFPVVVKARRSSGSRTFCLANNELELAQHLAEIPQPLVQQYMEAAGGEFSVGVFACQEFTAAIAFRRELGPMGLSWFAETSDDREVLDYALDIAGAIGLLGSANVQVRKTKSGVRLLEINPRFSSLAAARAFCGFRDVEWSVKMALGAEISPPPSEFRKVRFRRFFHELVDWGEGYRGVPDWNPRQAALLGGG